MEIEVKTLNEDGSIAFEGVLKDKEVSFVMGIGLNFLLANGATPYLRDKEDSMVGPSTNTKQ